MTEAEAWLQCSARGTTVTRMAYIGVFHLSCARGGTRRDRSITREETPAPWFILLVTSSPTSSSHHCIIAQLEEQLVACHLVLYTD